jgi:hypothetical protein
VPQGLTVTVIHGGRIDLSWNASTDSELAGYHVYRDVSIAALATVTATFYSDTSVVPGTRYSYAVRAFDVAGNESAMSATQTVITPPGVTVPGATAPGAPTGVTATAGNSSAVVAWTQPSDGGSPITGYTVTANPGAMTATVGGNATAATVTGLTNGTSYTFAVFATNAVGDGPTSAPSNAVAPSAPGTMFPLVHSSNQRYLQDQNAVPFPVLGRAAWFIISLEPADYRLFIDDSGARGNNAIEMHVLDHDFRGRHPPRNGNGDLPFSKKLDGSDWDGSLVYSNIDNEAPDFTKPNEAYWSYVDDFLAYCESRGTIVLFFPAYTGTEGGEQGWIREMLANGPARMNAYGAWIAARYANRKNLVWMAGGDWGVFTPAQFNVESALLAGLKSVAGQQSVEFNASWDSETISTDQLQFGSLMTLNSVHSFEGGPVSSLGRRAYAHSPPLPAFLLESPYDEEGADGLGVNLNATQPVRRFQWWGWLATVGGYVSGNGYLWPFLDPDWKSHLGAQGSRDMARLNAFIKSIPWWNLVPSGLAGMKPIVTLGGGLPTAPDYVAAAATPDGTLMVVYVPPAHEGSITIDMTIMTGPSTARWLNPATGAFIPISTSLPNDGSPFFTPLCDNGPGFSDCVLVIEKNP